jgi:hypothetical protein
MYRNVLMSDRASGPGNCVSAYCARIRWLAGTIVMRHCCQRNESASGFHFPFVPSCTSRKLRGIFVKCVISEAAASC